MAAFNAYARIDQELPAKPTLPQYTFREIDTGKEAEEAAARAADVRTIRAGRDAWRAIGEAETYERYKAIAAALVIGRDFALRSSGANSTNGRLYTLALKDWLDQNFGRARPMPKQFRYYCFQLHEHLTEIEVWRATLPERQCQRLVNPVSVVRRWQRATKQPKRKCVDDQVKAAAVAWRRFMSSVEALPIERALPFWKAAMAEARLHA
jgi:hypothetical protein